MTTSQISRANFGGWSIEKCVYDYIYRTLPKGSHILELGSGYGSTKHLVQEYQVTSVEHDIKWLDKWAGVRYIHAPIKDHKPVQKFDDHQWYDANILKDQIPRHYDLLLVDGPPQRYGRAGLIKYWFDLFRQDKPVIFDDCNRYDDWRIACKISARMKSPLIIYTYLGDKQFGVVDPTKYVTPRSEECDEDPES